MAFLSNIAGDRYIAPERGNVKAKVPNTAYTPAVGDLVTIVAAGINNNVALISGIVAIVGIVENISGWSSAFPLRPISVAEFFPGAEIELAYTGAVAIGDKVVFSTNIKDTVLGTLPGRTKVLTDNTNGVGAIIAKDAGAPHGTGFCVVRF